MVVWHGQPRLGVSATWHRRSDFQKYCLLDTKDFVRQLGEIYRKTKERKETPSLPKFRIYMVATAHDGSVLFVELGLAIVGLALLARLANRWGFSAIPLYLLAGLAFGNGGIAPLDLSENFIHIGAEIGVLLLLFMLGLEYTGNELKESLRKGLPTGIVDLTLNFPPGLIAGLLLGWRPLAAILLGGITYISSS